MGLHGQNIIACQPSSNQNRTLRGFSTMLSRELEPAFQEATIEQVNDALESAEKAFHIYRSRPAQERAALLERIADEIAALGDELIERCHVETGLTKDRLAGERARTINQLRMFAGLIR